MKGNKYPEFDLPSGFQTPENVADDGEFEALATVKLSNGRGRLVALDGNPLFGNEQKEEFGEPKPKESNATGDDRGFSNVVMGALRGGGAHGGGI